MACCLGEFGEYNWTLEAKTDIGGCVGSVNVTAAADPALYSEYLQNRGKGICKTFVSIQPQQTTVSYKCSNAVNLSMIAGVCVQNNLIQSSVTH